MIVIQTPENKYMNIKKAERARNKNIMLYDGNDEE